jgi:hypothetical protein
MHVADQLFAEAFEVQIDGKQVGPGAVFPDWSPLDRFGIVVTEPLGGLGASLLLQLAIALFYSVRPDRRAGMAMYPEIYLFHVGGPHGDFSYFDFWPPRKEVRVAAAAPVSLLEAINAHAITRLAVPPTQHRDHRSEDMPLGPVTWLNLGGPFFSGARQVCAGTGDSMADGHLRSGRPSDAPGYR